MPAVMTFTSLQDTMRAYLERGTPSDTTVFDQIPNLINLAERAVARKMKIQGFLKIVVSKMQAGVNVYKKPDRWRQTASMRFGSNTQQLVTQGGQPIETQGGAYIVAQPVSGTFNSLIYPRGLEYCQQYWPDGSQRNQPKFYADYDYAHWLLVPTPDLAYPWGINYYELPPLLDDDNETNWLTYYAPNLLLYRCLLEATPFLKNDERIPVWQKFYDDEMAATSTEDLQRAADRSAKRNNP